MDSRFYRSTLVLGLVFLIAPHSGAQKVPEPVESATYDVAFFLDRARPDDKPNPKVGPHDPDAPIGPETQLLSRTEARAKMIKLVQQTIDPESWKPGHVPPAAISIDGDKMVVTQTVGNLRGIANLLQQLHGDGSEKVLAVFNATRLPVVKFDKTPIAQVVQAIAAQSKVPIAVDWPSFMIAPLAADSPVTIEVKQATVGRAIRSVFNSAAGFSLLLRIDATPKGMRVSFDTTQPTELVTRVYDLQPLPARTCGLIPKTPFTRAQAISALVDRIEKEVLHSKRYRQLNGQIIVTTAARIHLQLVSYLDDLDAKAIAEAEKK